VDYKREREQEREKGREKRRWHLQQATYNMGRDLPLPQLHGLIEQLHTPPEATTPPPS
jgi:hypothetical protein